MSQPKGSLVLSPILEFPKRRVTLGKVSQSDNVERTLKRGQKDPSAQPKCMGRGEKDNAQGVKEEMKISPSCSQKLCLQVTPFEDGI